MSEYLQLVYDWINAHPGWAQLLLFVITCLDAVFILGAFIPAGVVLFAMGALIALGSIDLWTTVAIAAAGALCGDGLSFWLGRRYGEQLFQGRLMQRYPDALNNARRFFDRHGGKGVMLARFLGPVRSVTPALAGAANMPAWLFLLTDGVAATAWALAYILPGVVFGASLGLAAEVAGRLALLVLLLALFVWLVIALTGVVIKSVQKRAEDWVGALLDWSRRHRRLGRFGAALADPDQPETPVLAVMAFALMLLGGLWLYFWAAPGFSPDPKSFDVAVFQALRELHTPWGIALAQALLQLGEWPVYLPVAVTVFLSLLLARKGRATAHWLGALGFALLISGVLYFVPTIPPPFEQFGSYRPTGYRALDLVLATVIYAFIPVLLATGRRPGLRVLIYGLSIALLLLIVLARLYLGAQWWSLATFSLLLGVVWTALLGLGYRRHQPERVSGKHFVTPVLVVFVVASALQWSDDRALAHEPLPTRPLSILQIDDWASAGYQKLRQQRQDIVGRPRQPFNLQWAGKLDTIEAQLRQRGWIAPTPLSLQNALRWLAPSTPVEQLPLLPQVHAGRHQALILRYPLAGEPDRQYLIRLWPTGYRTEQDQPIWVGYIALQQTRSVYRLLRYPVYQSTPAPLPKLIGDLPQSEVLGAGAVWRLKS
ncbi:MAG TPA: VTT domain-containing protein [Solimonas sp.]|nr:VTT domain-containing protein [Solimonas sp.]